MSPILTQGDHHLPSVRGDLLAKLGRMGEARAEFERAASLTRNTRERELLLERAAECTSGPEPRQTAGQASTRTLKPP